MMSLRQSLAVFLFLAITGLLYVLPELLQPSVLAAYFIFGSLLLLEEKSAHRMAFLAIGALTFSIIFLAQISPFAWLTERGVNFALATILTILLPFAGSLIVLLISRGLVVLAGRLGRK